MNSNFLILLMFFMHGFGDYYMQGKLSPEKKKEWWKKNVDNKKCQYDYIAALFIHSFTWAFLIMLPIAAYMNFHTNIAFMIIMGINVIVHMIVDNEKANKHSINLIMDQLIHIIQIGITVLIVLEYMV